MDLAELVTGHRRIGHRAIVVATEATGLVQRVYRFDDGFEQFIVKDADGLSETLNQDEVAFLEEVG